MTIIHNLTPFEAATLPSLDRAGHNLQVFVVAGRFVLPPGGSALKTPPEIHPEQRPPVLVDTYHGDPITTSLRYEGQIAYHRPGADIYLQGHARSPKGEPVKEMLTQVRVGELYKNIRISGDRIWESGLLAGAKPSPPLPFTEMPLLWERAYGGSIPVAKDQNPQFEPRNPVGRGLYKNTKAALGNPLPNLEDPDHAVKSLGDKPPPAAYGPIARHWQPRAGFGGTYDQIWQEQRAPLWPKDFDERFFQAAAPGMWAHGRLHGGEPVYLEGFSHGGAQAFPLPKHHLQARVVFADGSEKIQLECDTLSLDVDNLSFTMIWRGHVSTHARMAQLQETFIREIAPWEADL